MKRRRGDDAAAREQIRRDFLCLAVCHELKQPLHSLNLNVELLSKRLGGAAQPPEINAPLQAFGRVVDRINDCLEAFAGRTAPAPPGRDPFDVIPLLARAAERARAARPDVRVTLLGPAELPIPCSPDALAYAFDALIDNALHATPGVGEIILNAKSGEEEVHIDVIDHGAGMSADVARRAFEIGFSTWGGDGVGLTLAKFITYHHSGGFSVSSRPGQGTTVSIVLPTTSEELGDTVGD